MIQGIIAILIGLVLVIFRKNLVRDGHAWQEENFGLKFGSKQIKIDEAICIGVGLLFIIAGILFTFGILKLR